MLPKLDSVSHLGLLEGYLGLGAPFGETDLEILEERWNINTKNVEVKVQSGYPAKLLKDMGEKLESKTSQQKRESTKQKQGSKSQNKITQGTSTVAWQLLHVAAYFGHEDAVKARKAGNGRRPVIAWWLKNPQRMSSGALVLWKVMQHFCFLPSNPFE